VSQGYYRDYYTAIEPFVVGGKLKEISDTQLIHEFTKNGREKVRVEFMNYRGNDVLNLWVYYNADPARGDWRPSKKGLSISTDLVADLKEAVEKAHQAWEQNSGQKDCQQMMK
jgi:hypothetical protein